MSSIAAFLYALLAGLLVFPGGYWLARAAFHFIDQQHRLPGLYAEDWCRINAMRYADWLFMPLFVAFTAMALVQAKMSLLGGRVATIILIVVSAAIATRLTWVWCACMITVPRVYRTLLLGVRLLTLAEAVNLVIIASVPALTLLCLVLAFYGLFIVAILGFYQSLRWETEQMKRKHLSA